MDLPAEESQQKSESASQTYKAFKGEREGSKLLLSDSTSAHEALASVLGCQNVETQSCIDYPAHEKCLPVSAPFCDTPLPIRKVVCDLSILNCSTATRSSQNVTLASPSTSLCCEPTNVSIVSFEDQSDPTTTRENNNFGLSTASCPSTTKSSSTIASGGDATFGSSGTGSRSSAIPKTKKNKGTEFFFIPPTNLARVGEVPDRLSAPSYRRKTYDTLFVVIIWVTAFLFGSTISLREFSTNLCWSDSHDLRPSTNTKILCSEKSIFRFLPLPLRDLVSVTLLSNPVDLGGLQLKAPQPFSRLSNGLYGLTSTVLDLMSKNQEVMPSIGQKFTSDLKRRLQKVENSGQIDDALKNSLQSRALQNHNIEFGKRIERVKGNLYVAIGYGLANVVIIDTQEGLILFDTLEAPSAMRRLMTDWVQYKQSTNKTINLNKHRWGQPIVAIFYSHFHSDHVFGASAVYEKGFTQIWTHQKTADEISRVFVLTAGTTYKRSMRQFGNLLTDKDGYINAGIGLRLDFGGSDESNHAGVIAPTNIWSGTTKAITIAGERLQLIFAPGESRDQSIIWFPDRNILFGADNIYKSFPNIYAIRGTQSRDALIWVKSLDQMRQLKPDILVLGHTGVLKGKENIYETLTAYRDAIQFIHDQTVRQMNKGKSIHEIVKLVDLPPQLKNHPYLQPYYGTAEWAVRAVYDHYVGWYSGRPEDLSQMSLREKSEKMLTLVGGRDKLLKHSMEAIENHQYQWALELISFARVLAPKCHLTKRLQIAALRALAAIQTSAPGRNWYLTSAKEVEEDVHSSKLTLMDRLMTLIKTFKNKENKKTISEQLKVSQDLKRQIIGSLKSVVDSFQFLPNRVKVGTWDHTNVAVVFNFTDTKEAVCLHFRNGIVAVTHTCEKKSDINSHPLQIETTDQVWRDIISNDLNPLIAVGTGRLKVMSTNPKDYILFKNVMNLIEMKME